MAHKPAVSANPAGAGGGEIPPEPVKLDASCPVVCRRPWNGPKLNDATLH